MTVHTGVTDASDRRLRKTLPFVGCDWLTLTFPLADTDLWRLMNGESVWRSADDSSSATEDSGAWDDEAEGSDLDDGQHVEEGADEDDRHRTAPEEESGAHHSGEEIEPERPEEGHSRAGVEQDNFDDQDAGAEDAFDDDHYRAELEQEGPDDLAPLASNGAPLTVLYRDLKVAGAPVHIRVWQRGDQWGAPGPRYIGEDRGDRWWASVAFNPSRLRAPKGWQLCPAAEARTWACVLLVLLARAGVVVPQCEHVNGLTAEHEEIEPVFDLRTGAAKGERRVATGRSFCKDFACLERTVTVSRVDATMDFTGVHDASTLVDVFMGHRQARAGSSKRRYSPVSASATAGRTGHRVAVYDKCVQSRRPGRPRSAWAPPGTLRVEVGVRSRRLQKLMCPPQLQGVPGLAGYSRRLAHLTPELLAEVFMDGFAWAGLDRWYGGGRQIEPIRGGSMTKTTAHRLVHFLDERAAGRPAHEVVDNTVRRYEKLAAEWGYIVGVPRSRNCGPLRHLDLWSSAETRPSVAWRLARGLVGARGAAAVSFVQRRPRPSGWERPARRRPVRRERARTGTGRLSG